MSGMIKTCITKDGGLLLLKIHDKDKSVITNHLTHIESNIQSNQKINEDPIIEIKKMN